MFNKCQSGSSGHLAIPTRGEIRALYIDLFFYGMFETNKRLANQDPIISSHTEPEEQKNKGNRVGAQRN